MNLLDAAGSKDDAESITEESSDQTPAPVRGQLVGGIRPGVNGNKEGQPSLPATKLTIQQDKSSPEVLRSALPRNIELVSQQPGSSHVAGNDLSTGSQGLHRSLTAVAQDPALLSALHSAALKQPYSKVSHKKLTTMRRFNKHEPAQGDTPTYQEPPFREESDRESSGLMWLRAMLAR